MTRDLRRRLDRRTTRDPLDARVELARLLNVHVDQLPPPGADAWREIVDRVEAGITERRAGARAQPSIARGGNHDA